MLNLLSLETLTILSILMNILRRASPWWTPECDNAIRACFAALKNYRQIPSIENYEAYPT